MKTLVAEVVLDGATGSFDKEYSYAVPRALTEKAKAGCRVIMPFGRGNIKRQGMIIGLKEDENNSLKEIYDITDKEPILSDEMLMLCRFLRERTFCTYFDAIKSMLPAGLNYRLTSYYTVNEEFVSASLLSENEKTIYEYIKENPQISEEKLKGLFDDAVTLLYSLEDKQAIVKDSLPIRKGGDLTRRWVKISDSLDTENLPKLTSRQKEIFDLVSDFGEVSIKELQYFTGVTVSVINNLVSKAVLESFEKQEFRTPYRFNSNPQRTEINLTDEQQKAFDGIKSELDSGNPTVSLLYGVTGSGKTQVFLKLTDYVSDMDKGVIIMVPEIALTPQIIEIFNKRYGSRVAVFHSAMSQGQRMDEYKRVKEGRATIAIGTRSAVFAPFADLGLVIIDEEQEHTYKSEKSPRFHARDVAKFRANYHKCALCLASATPSVDSFSMAQNGRYKLFTLTKRYGNAILPEVTAVDMKKELLNGNSGSISGELATAIGKTLKDKNQAIVLLNRRGHNTYISCPSCGWVASCPNCSISMTYHSANGRMMCHYCGYSEPKPSKCPQCGAEYVRFMGVGTQKVEEELSLLFPEAKILRLDADSTMSRDSYAKYLTEFSEGKYDIMLGTQMVAKGLNFPNVTLVGVIGADHATYSEDYRSFERTFSLLTQVVGRAGRGDSKGRAIIQTVNPESSIISLAAAQNYDAFYEEEILTRKLHIYPPYCDICVVWAQSSVREQAEDAINEIFSKIKEKLKDEYKQIKLVILGPCASAVPRVNGRYRFKLLIKCRNSSDFRACLRESTTIRLKGDTAVFADINPETLI